MTQGRLARTASFCQASQLPVGRCSSATIRIRSARSPESLEVIGERWTLLILRDAVLGMTRFEEFQESLGIASNVLTNRLKLLCDEDVLERVPDPERPGRPKYVLTDKGLSSVPP